MTCLRGVSGPIYDFVLLRSSTRPPIFFGAKNGVDDLLTKCLTASIFDCASCGLNIFIRGMFKVKTTAIRKG